MEINNYDTNLEINSFGRATLIARRVYAEYLSDMNVHRGYRSAIRKARFRGLFNSYPGFGQAWHQFKAGQRLAEADLRQREERWGQELPSEYREFLTQVANGGAGPAYGLSPLSEAFAPYSTEPSPGFLVRPFTPEGPRENGLLPGAVRICNLGCEHYVLMAVNGPSRGMLFHDAQIDGLGVIPLHDKGHHLSFLNWLSLWVDTLEAGDLLSEFWSTHSFPRHAIPIQLSAAQDPLDLIATDQLPCLACMRELSVLRPIPEVVVPSFGTEFPLPNPKMVAAAAAHSNRRVVSRPVVPSPKFGLVTT